MAVQVPKFSLHTPLQFECLLLNKGNLSTGCSNDDITCLESSIMRWLHEEMGAVSVDVAAQVGWGRGAHTRIPATPYAHLIISPHITRYHLHTGIQPIPSSSSRWNSALQIGFRSYWPGTCRSESQANEHGINAWELVPSH